jgi:hypothetical protein
MSAATPQTLTDSRNIDFICDYNNYAFLCPVTFEGPTITVPPGITPFGTNTSPPSGTYSSTQQTVVLNSSAASFTAFTIPLPTATTGATVNIIATAECVGGANLDAGGTWGSQYSFVIGNRAGVVNTGAIIQNIHNYQSWASSYIPVWGTNTITGTTVNVIMTQNIYDIVDYTFWYQIVYSA